MLAIFVVVGMLVYQVTRWIYLLYFHPLAEYPGPGLARVTNFWRLWSFFKGRQHLVDLDLHARYGKFVRDGPESLLVSDIESFKTIYGFTGKLNKGDFYALASNGKPEDPDIFSARTDSQHKPAKKKLVSAAFAPKHITQYESSITNNVDNFLQSVESHVQCHDGTFNIAPSCERFMFDAVMGATYGSSMDMLLGEDQAGVVASKKAAFPLRFGIPHVPWLGRLVAKPTIIAFFQRPRYNEDGRPKGLSAAYAWARKVFHDAKCGNVRLSPCVLRNMLESDSSDSRKLSSEIMWHECFNLIFAGTGSTAGALLATLYEMGRHPEWQSRLRADIKRLAENEDFDAAHLSRLESLQAILKEALRVHPPFPVPFERIIAPGAESAVAKVKPLPAGTRIWSNLFVMSRSEEVFGDEPDDFRPERWLESSQEVLRRMDDMFCVFGRGSRSCIGRNIAWMILEKTLVAVVQKWNVLCGQEALKGKAVLEMHYDELMITLTPRSE